MKYIIFLLIVLIFGGCSFSTPANDWQYKSSNAFDAYTKDFLSSKDTIAINDINRAISHAKSSSDLTQLAKVYLGECALNISVGIKDECIKYQNIKDLVNSKELDAYYLFLRSDTNKENIKYLPQRYKDFANHLHKKDYKEANSDILDMQKVTSILLTSALLKKHIDKQTVDKTLSIASFYGYKKAVIFWLHEKQKKLTDTKEIQKIKKKILILKEKNENM